MALEVIGVAISAAGAIMQGIQQQKMMNYQAELQERQAEISLDNAARAVHRSQVEQESQDMAALALLGQQEAIQAASGLGGRSQALTRKSSRMLARQDALNVRQAGELEAESYVVDAEGLQASAHLSRMSGQNALLSGFLGATQSLVSLAPTVKRYGKYSRKVAAA